MPPTATTLLVCALLASASVGQNGLPANKGAQRPYVELPIPPGFEDFLRSQFLRADENLELQKLLNAFRNNPALRHLDPRHMPGFDLNDPQIRNRLKDLVGNGGPKLDPDKLKDLQRAVEDRLRAIKEKPDEPVVRPPDHPRVPPPAEAPNDTPTEKDKLGRWLQETLLQAENGRWGEFVRNSPSLQKAIADLQANIGRRGFDPGRMEWLRKLKIDSIKAPAWRPNLDGIRNIDLPRLGRINIPTPRLPNLNFGAPRVSAPTGPSDWSSLAWIPALFVLASLAWLLLKRGQVRATAPGGAVLPPHPESVSTRDDFIRAFEQLALAKLGLQARTWNHVAAAADLEHATGQPEVCRRLARLYEAARYAPGEAPLSDDDRLEARRLLASASAGAAMP